MSTANATLLEHPPDQRLAFETELEAAARQLDLEAWVVQRLKHPEREITVNLPLTRDDGSTLNVTGYRVQNSRTAGPSIGPVWLSSGVALGELRVLAAEITLQAALAGLRHGGAAGAIVVDADQLSEREMRHLVKEYVTALGDNLGPMTDAMVPANDHLAGWMEQAYARAHTELGTILSPLTSAWAGAMTGLVKVALDAESLNGVRFAIDDRSPRAQLLIRRIEVEGGRFLVDNEALSAGADVALVSRPLATAPPSRVRLVIELAHGVRPPDFPGDAPGRVLPFLLAGLAELAIASYAWKQALTCSAVEPLRAESEARLLLAAVYEQVRDLGRKQALSLRQATWSLALAKAAETFRYR